MRELTVNESKAICGGASDDKAITTLEKNVLNDGFVSADSIFEKIHDKVHHHNCRQLCVISSFLKKH